MKVLVFAPHAGIWVHAFPEALIAESLMKADCHVSYVTCDTSLKDFCVVMNAFGLDINATRQDKKNICQVCCKNNTHLKNAFKFPMRALNDYLLDSDEKNIEDLVRSLDVASLLNFKEDDISIGRLTLYQIILEFKKKFTGVY